MTLREFIENLISNKDIQLRESKPIYEFIEYVVNNMFPLNEYSEGEIKRLMDQFREEADDLNISITDSQLRKYIERFDQIKNSPKITEKDLRKYSLSKLIRLVSASAGADSDEDEDTTPDVVYQEGNITIWNGSKEDNCIRYGRGENWCITRGSYDNYRYSEPRMYPTFYLAKNNNLPASDALSFVAIQVRDASDESKRYVFTNRKNSPHESSPMSFESLLTQIPWLRDIPNIKSILKYIPLSNTEKANNIYSKTAIPIREWIRLPFSVKKQYLVIRKDKRGGLFSDISDSTFVSKYLPQYPQIAEFIAVTPGVIDSELLIQNLDKFSNQDRRSIMANFRDTFNTSSLKSDIFSFDVKKLLVVLNKWDLDNNERIYVTKDGSTIVLLKITSDGINMGLYQAEDDFPNVKLNSRTAKYINDYPDLDKLPIGTLLKLSEDGVLSKEALNSVIEKAKSDPNSSIVVNNVDGNEILLDSNTFKAYKLEGDKVIELSPDSEEAKAAFTQEQDNASFAKKALNILSNREEIPELVNKSTFVRLINSIPYAQRTEEDGVWLAVDSEEGTSVWLMPTDLNDIKKSPSPYGVGDNWRSSRMRNVTIKTPQLRAIVDYLRGTNKTLSDNNLKNFLSRGNYYDSVTVERKKEFFRMNPPLSDTNTFRPAFNGNDLLLINTANPRESLKLSDSSGKLIKANVPSSLASRLLGNIPRQNVPAAGAATPQVRRRGRPAAGGQPRAAEPAAAAPDAGGDINVSDVMDETGLDTAFVRLPRADFRRLNVTTGVRVNPNGDRGAARRNNQLGNAGRVQRVISVGSSKIYLIRLANQQIIASINIQPGNRNYLLTGNEDGNVALPLDSPAALLSALRMRNLAEIQSYIMNEYLAANPTHLEEVKNLLRKTINEKKK